MQKTQNCRYLIPIIKIYFKKKNLTYYKLIDIYKNIGTNYKIIGSSVLR